MFHKSWFPLLRTLTGMCVLCIPREDTQSHKCGLWMDQQWKSGAISYRFSAPFVRLRRILLNHQRVATRHLVVAIYLNAITRITVMIDRTCLQLASTPPLLPTLPSVHFPAFQAGIGRSIGCHSSPEQTLALLILSVTRPRVVHTCKHKPFYCSWVSLSHPPPPLSWTTNSQYPGTTPISHVWKSEHIFVIITHLADSWVC